MVIRMRYEQQARATTSNPPTPPSGAELREQIRQTIQDAQQAALDAALAGRRASIAAQGVGSDLQPAIAPVPPVPPVPPGGAYTIHPGDFNNDVPPQVVDISIAFFVCSAIMVIGWPLARAFGKRIERKSEVAAVNPAMTDQLQRIEQAVDAMAIEIERISESQRFMAKLQHAQTPERVALPADRG